MMTLVEFVMVALAEVVFVDAVTEGAIEDVVEFRTDEVEDKLVELVVKVLLEAVIVEVDIEESVDDMTEEDEVDDVRLLDREEVEAEDKDEAIDTSLFFMEEMLLIKNAESTV